MIQITKVVTKNFIMDIYARIQNFFGANITSYEDMVAKGYKQIEDELKERQIKLKWYRFEISQLTSGAMVIMLYGDEK